MAKLDPSRAARRARRKQVTIAGPMPVIPSPVGIGRFGGVYAKDEDERVQQAAANKRAGGGR